MAGVYMRWVAEGHSPRFSINTTRALDQVMAGAIAGRDPVSTFDTLSLDPPSHGTALDRVSAFQTGFDVGADGCAAIDSAEIQQRRGNLPPSLFDPASPQSDITIDEQTLSTLMELLGQIFTPANPPTLATTGEGCSASQQQPVAYCPDTNTIGVDLPTLRQIGAPADESDFVLLQGDNTALSMVTSRYVLALQHEKGLALNTPVAAMRTACLTGVAQRKMADPIRGPSGNQLVLGAGDLDEAVSGLLTNGDSGHRCQRDTCAVRVHPDPRVSYRSLGRCRRLLSAVRLRESARERTAGPPSTAGGAVVEERQHTGSPAADAGSATPRAATAATAATVQPPPAPRPGSAPYRHSAPVRNRHAKATSSRRKGGQVALLIAVGVIAISAAAIGIVFGLSRFDVLKGKVLNVSKAEAGVQRILLDPVDGYGVTSVTDVVCNNGDDPEIKKGGTFTCEVVVDGRKRQVLVVFSDDNGTYEVDRPR